MGGSYPCPTHKNQNAKAWACLHRLWANLFLHHSNSTVAKSYRPDSLREVAGESLPYLLWVLPRQSITTRAKVDFGKHDRVQQKRCAAGVESEEKNRVITFFLLPDNRSPESTWWFLAERSIEDQKDLLEISTTDRAMYVLPDWAQ